MVKVLNAITVGACIILIALLIVIIWASFLPQDIFHADRGVAHWLIRIDESAQSALIPFEILQPISTERFQAKSAFIFYTLFKTLIFMVVFLYGLKQIKNILQSIAFSYTPFTIQNAKWLKRISFIIIGYALFGDLIVNLLITLFVTGIFSIAISIFNILGLIIGVLLLIISQVFLYGAYLQEEFDTTL